MLAATCPPPPAQVSLFPRQLSPSTSGPSCLFTVNKQHGLCHRRNRSQLEATSSPSLQIASLTPFLLNTHPPNTQRKCVTLHLGISCPKLRDLPHSQLLPFSPRHPPHPHSNIPMSFPSPTLLLLPPSLASVSQSSFTLAFSTLALSASSLFLP